MNRIERFLGKICDDCALCRYARGNPETITGKIMIWHGKWCPAWKAGEKIRLEVQEQVKIFNRSKKKKR